MYLKVILVVLIALCCTTYVNSARSVNYLGCYKFLTKPTVCQLKSTEEQLKLSNTVTTSLANGLQWLREQQKSKLWVDIPTTSWVMTNMILAGYINDNSICTRTIQDSLSKIHRSLKDTADISAGQLALIMIGMKATCQDVTNFNHQNLIEILTDNMDNFPKDDFNNYYQYSLGILALHVNRVNIPVKFGMKLLQHFLANKNQGMNRNEEYMSDTDALSIIALSAMTRQAGMSNKFLNQANKVINTAEKIIDNIMNTTKLENLVTMTHVLQVLQIRKSALSRKSYCKKAMEWILKRSDASGSFEGLMPTAGLLPLLSGVSILELKNMKCPIATDDKVNEKKIKDFIASRWRKPTGTTTASNEEIQVAVELFSEVLDVNINRRVRVVLTKGATALEALRAASKKDRCFHFRQKDTAWGPFVDKICKIEQNHKQGMYWMFYVNGKLAPVGAGKYKVKDDDNITFKYKRM